MFVVYQIGDRSTLIMQTRSKDEAIRLARVSHITSGYRHIVVCYGATVWDSNNS